VGIEKGQRPITAGRLGRYSIITSEVAASGGSGQPALNRAFKPGVAPAAYAAAKIQHSLSKALIPDSL
jgi:hypothetical protein